MRTFMHFTRLLATQYLDVGDVAELAGAANFGGVSGDGGGQVTAINSDFTSVTPQVDLGTYDVFIQSGNNVYADDFLNDTLLNSMLLLSGANSTATAAIDLNATRLNGTAAADGDTSAEDLAQFVIATVTSVLLGLMILMTIIGNVFVIAAICVDRNLRSVANYLVASLALADLMVACLVMPFGALYEINRGWKLGAEVCDFWTMCDVLCCTASILHLVAIATDRYWAVTRVDYIHSRTSGRVKLMICMVWTLAIIVSLAPQFGFKDDDYMRRIEMQKCMVSQDVAYQIFATCATFYVPLLVILVLYWKIYQTARKRIHRRPKAPTYANNNQLETPKKKFRLAGKFTSSSKKGKGGKSSMGLVQGNSTNTVNTVEDTDYSSNDPTTTAHVPISCHGGRGGGSGGIVVTTTQFTNGDGCGSGGGIGGPIEEMPGTCQISTVSQQVAQQHMPPIGPTPSPASASPPPINGGHHHSAALATAAQPTTAPTNSTTTAMTTTATTSSGTTTTTPNAPTSLAASPLPAVATSTAAAAAAASASHAVVPTDSQHQQMHHIHQIQSAAMPPAALPAAVAATNPHQQVRNRKETLEAKRERKAAKTLAIITGAFVICWLPFFVTVLVTTLCQSCEVNDQLAAFFLWLGYFNSTLNPVIYTVFSPEFRQAFKRLLCGARPNRGGQYYRGGKL